jgi:micrococcal nuclease
MATLCRRVFGPLLVLIAACADPAVGPPTVIEVVDGDTIVIEVGGATERLRLLGIDTPESVDPTRPVQCFGPEASARLAELLPPGTPIRVERDTEARDRYGRLLGYVHRADDDLFVNEALLRDGYADLLVMEPNTAYTDALRTALTAARTANAGLWGVCGGADVALDPPPPTG